VEAVGLHRVHQQNTKFENFTFTQRM